VEHLLLVQGAHSEVVDDEQVGVCNLVEELGQRTLHACHRNLLEELEEAAALTPEQKEGKERIDEAVEQFVEEHSVNNVLAKAEEEKAKAKGKRKASTKKKEKVAA
ncbi:MAG: hypothetical protein K6G92_03965, partial [Bacteroidaceae bacterium]|nr:hypothetical protein [Bacteroidaceae bacterium]